MSTPTTPITQAIVDEATSVLGDAATGLLAVAAALPALIAVTNVVDAANAVSALIPAPAAPPAPTGSTPGGVAASAAFPFGSGGV
jgi:hypothetical protein